MSDGTKIEWADASWNPIRVRRHDPKARLSKIQVGWHCEHVSEGCRNCYAEGFNLRLGTGLEYRRQDRDAIEVFLDEKTLVQPLSWRRPRRIFVESMSDLFGEWVPFEMIDKVMAVASYASHHQFIVLTKRHARMREYFGPSAELGGITRDALVEGEAQSLYHKRTGDDPSMWLAVHWPIPNVWLGVSVEDQATADVRIPSLLNTPAAVRFLSVEPLLGPVDLSRYLGQVHHHPDNKIDTPETRAALLHVIEQVRRGLGPHISWVIVGGESGPKARPMHPTWARWLRDQCERAHVPFFFKQWGEWIAGRVFAKGNSGGHTMHQDGKEHPSVLSHWWSGDSFGGVISTRVGKAKAGRTLDGREHSEWPHGH